MRPKQSRHITKSKVAREVTRLVNGCDKTQYEIAAEMGLAKSNFITMLKQGRTKVPLERVVSLARACGEDPAKLMMLCLEEYHPEIIEALGESLRATLSDDEAAIMQTIRRARRARTNAHPMRTGSTPTKGARTGSADYCTTPEALKALSAFVRKNLVV